MKRRCASIGIIDSVFELAGWIMLALYWAALAVGAFAIFHAVRQRADAFTAVDKLNKPVWVGILVVAVLLIFVTSPVNFVGLLGVVAIGVYLADVRPRVDAIQRRPRW